MIARGLVPSVSRHESLKLTSQKLVRQEAATAGEFDITKCLESRVRFNKPVNYSTGK